MRTTKKTRSKDIYQFDYDLERNQKTSFSDKKFTLLRCISAPFFDVYRVKRSHLDTFLLHKGRQGPQEVKNGRRPGVGTSNTNGKTRTLIKVLKYRFFLRAV